MLMRARILGVLLLLCAVQEAGAQQLVVTVRDSLVRTPVAGAIVTATDQANGTRVYGLTNQDGRVTLKLPNAGSWVPSVRRIGIVPTSASAVRVTVGSSTSVLFAVANLRFSLPRVRVTAKAGVCGRAPSGINRTSALWEQVTLALRSSALTRSDSARAQSMRVRLHNRVRDPVLNLISSRIVRTGDGTGRSFFAADPDSLARFGYVRSEPDSMLAYYAPDDIVMLSDAFVRTHCFKTPTADADPALAELEFRPVPRRRVPDVAGVAYVDTVTGELRRIVFRFINAEAFIPKSAVHAGGDVSFRRLEHGEWVVADWMIRMPEIVRASWLTTRGLSGYQESGGSLLTAEEARADSLALVQQLLERDSLALVRGPADSVRLVSSAETSIVRIVNSAVIAAYRPLFVTARTVEARTRFAQRRAERDGVFIDSAGIAALGARRAYHLILAAPGMRPFLIPDGMSGPMARDDLLLGAEWRPGALVPMMAMPAASTQGQSVALCFPKVHIDYRALPLSLTELKQFYAVQVATMEVYAPDSRVATALRTGGSLIFSGNRCGVIHLQSYLDYPSRTQ